MFDLDKIEKDWKENSYRLTEEEIYELFQKGNSTQEYEYYGYQKYREKIRRLEYGYGYADRTPEERLLRSIFGEREEDKKKHEEFLKEVEKVESPEQAKPLEESLQKQVVEGCLDTVFDGARYWCDFLQGTVSLEELYYIGLESLMKSAKYCIHCGKPVFRLYVMKSMEKNVIQYLSRKTHISYRDVYQIIQSLEPKDNLQTLSLLQISNEKEELEKPTSIHYRLRNVSFEDSMADFFASEEFQEAYDSALEELSYHERTVMQLSYDEYGYPGLTYHEIAEYLGTTHQKVKNIKQRTLKKLRKNEALLSYRSF